MRPGRNVPAGALRLGIMYADGRRAATTGRPALRVDDPHRLILQPDAGGGTTSATTRTSGSTRCRRRGPVALVVSWSQQGIAEARAELDGAAIGQVAQRAVILWPDEPDTL